MSTHKQELVREVATTLTSYGFVVYLSHNGEYGFYTDGKRAVSFGGCWNWCLNFSGNYQQSRQSGTGWLIEKDQGVPTRDQAEEWIKANAPAWTGNHNPVYMTSEKLLDVYRRSSGYVKFEGV